MELVMLSRCQTLPFSEDVTKMLFGPFILLVLAGWKGIAKHWANQLVWALRFSWTQQFIGP